MDSLIIALCLAFVAAAFPFFVENVIGDYKRVKNSSISHRTKVSGHLAKCAKVENIEELRTSLIKTLFGDEEVFEHEVERMFEKYSTQYQVQLLIADNDPNQVLSVSFKHISYYMQKDLLLVWAFRKELKSRQPDSIVEYDPVSEIIKVLVVGIDCLKE